MPSLRTCFRYAVTFSAGAALFPVVGEFFVELAKENGVYEQPTQRVGVMLTLLGAVADFPGFKLGAGFIIGLACGLWVDAIFKRREQPPASAAQQLDRMKLADDAENLAMKIAAFAGEASSRSKVAWSQENGWLRQSNPGDPSRSLSPDLQAEEEGRMLEKFGEKYAAELWRIVALAEKCVPMDRNDLWNIKNGPSSIFHLSDIPQFLYRLAANLRYPDLPGINLAEPQR